ncbi:MAG: sigma-70 family RNA polymerase sigma factor [Clostridiales bacterium]|jgi:RNA polymerase sigma-70 factor (ECF subfamily)|nr:sigma-70 family RNA polymerase sigma factor [Clostridiales bacterium]
MNDRSALTDCELISLCLNGENDGFAELVARYKNLVYSIIARMTRDRDEAADIAQDVFVKVYKNLDKYYPEYKFSTWIMRITTNHIIDTRRKRKTDESNIDDAKPIASQDPGPEEVLIAKERNELLGRIVAALPDMYKIPIVLYHQQGLSYQEIAEVIGEPLSKVKNRIFRGRKLLKQSYAEGMG